MRPVSDPVTTLSRNEPPGAMVASRRRLIEMVYDVAFEYGVGSGEFTSCQEYGVDRSKPYS